MTATRKTKPSKGPARAPRRFRQAVAAAEAEHDARLDALERATIIDLDQHRPPPAPEPERVPLHDRPMLEVVRPALIDRPRDEIAWARAVIRNRAAYYGWSLPGYAMVVARLAVAGGRRLARDLAEYVQMPQALEAIAQHQRAGNVEAVRDLGARYEKRRKARRRHVGNLAKIAAAVAVVLAVTPIVLWAWLGWLALPIIGGSTGILGTTVIGALAVYERRRRPAPAVSLVKHRVERTESRPSPELVHQAFEAANIPDTLCELAPRRAGPGWETTVRLPVGRQTYRTVVDQHAAIAGNLGIGSEGLFLERGPTEKHVIVWWSKRDPFTGPPDPNPILTGSAPPDPWTEGLSIGTDARGNPVRIPIVDTPFHAIGGQPGAGKTFALFNILAGIAPLPIWDADCWSFKSSNDFAPVEPLVRACGGTFRYGSDPATFEAFRRYLMALRSDVIRRNEILATLPIERNRNAKIERDVAADPALGLRPRIVIADEIQSAIGHPGVLAELIELARIARSQNVVMILGFQWIDRETIEKFDRAIGTRICLSVAKLEDSKGVLGGAHEPGIAEAHKIPLSAKAVAIVAGAVPPEGQPDRGAFKMRGHGVDRQLLDAHIARCLAGPRAHQVAARATATGPVVLEKGIGSEAVAWREKVAAVFEPDETVLTLTVLAERLGYGTGPAAAKALATDARSIGGVEPQRDTSGGKATGQRGVLFLALDQLTTDGA